MKHSSLFGAAAALALLSAAPLRAQSTGHLNGVVNDETGGPIRGATVRAEISSGDTLTAATDEHGRFLFLVTRSGVWTLTFEAPGFFPATRSYAVRQAAVTPRIDVKLDRNEMPGAFGAMAGVDSKQLTSALDAAAALFDQGRYDQAIAAYREIKAKAPALTLVNLQLGNALLMKKSYSEAETAFQEILSANATDASGLFAMGTAKEAQGKSDEAKDWYLKASSADVSWTRPLMKLAAMAGTGGDKATAARYLSRVIELDPGSPDAVQAQTLQKQLQ